LDEDGYWMNPTAENLWCCTRENLY